MTALFAQAPAYASFFSGDTMRGNETRDDEWCISSEGRRDHRCSGQPPRHLPAGKEVFVEALGSLAGEVEALQRQTLILRLGEPAFQRTQPILNVVQRVANLSLALVGHIRGGLSQVVTVFSMFFSEMSGSTTADVPVGGQSSISLPSSEGFAYAVVLKASRRPLPKS